MWICRPLWWISKSNWTWYFNFCLMNVGGNKGRNGWGGLKKRTEWGRVGAKLGKKEGRSKGRNQDQSLLHLLLLFPPAWVPQAHNELNRYSLLWTHPWHHQWVKASFWSCHFPLLQQGCFGLFVCGNLTFYLCLKNNLMGNFTLCWCLPGIETVICILIRIRADADF